MAIMDSGFQGCGEIGGIAELLGNELGASVRWHDGRRDMIDFPHPFRLPSESWGPTFRAKSQRLAIGRFVHSLFRRRGENAKV